MADGNLKFTVDVKNVKSVKKMVNLLKEAQDIISNLKMSALDFPTYERAILWNEKAKELLNG